MRALHCVLILITTVMLTAASLPVGGFAGRALASSPALTSSHNQQLLLADASKASPPAGASHDLEYLPQGGRHAKVSTPVRWFLIISTITIVVVIIGFIIRHHRSGRAG